MTAAEWELSAAVSAAQLSVTECAAQAQVLAHAIETSVMIEAEADRDGIIN